MGKSIDCKSGTVEVVEPSHFTLSPSDITIDTSPAAWVEIDADGKVHLRGEFNLEVLTAWPLESLFVLQRIIAEAIERKNRCPK